MKNFFIIVLLLILIFVCYFNIIHSNKDDVTKILIDERTSGSLIDSLNFGDETTMDAKELIEITDPYELPIDEKLPHLLLNNNADSVKTDKSEINVSVTIPGRVWRANLFLYLNNKKTDMFFFVPSGNYIFKSIKLQDNKNLIEIFYKTGNRRSKEISFEVIKN